MGSRLLGVMAVATAAAAAGCGGGTASHAGAASHGGTTAQGSTTSPSGATASASPLNIYVVRSGEEPGYPAQPPADYKTPQELQTNQAGYSPADLKRLGAEGFRGAAVEQTGSSLSGLSFVFELGSSAAAKRELAAEVTEDLQHGSPPGIRFKVSAIAGAVGVAYPSPAGGQSGGNVLFQEGRCMLLVGDVGTTSSYRKPAIAGATAIWKRTHALAGPCRS